MKVGILTGGGDAPGLNQVIRGIVLRLASEVEDLEIVGLRNGWKGLLEKLTMPLSIDMVENLYNEGGTVLGSSRTNPAKDEETMNIAEKNFKDLGLDALVALGGEDTLGAAHKLFKNRGLPIVGVPKTIDNDLSATDYTFGFDTATNIVMEAIDRLHTTARSHSRVMVVEIMGRHAGWITLVGGVAGGAHLVLIPEEPFSLDEVVKFVKKRYEQGKTYAIIAVAEGAKISLEHDVDGSFVFEDASRDEFGHIRLGGIAKQLAKYIEEKTGFETRYVVLGHLQRGGHPSAFDRFLATRMGIKAADLVLKKYWGKMVALRGTEIVFASLEEAVSELKTVPKELSDYLKVLYR